MTGKRARQVLEDILDGIQIIHQFTDGKSFSDYASDRMLRQAVERSIEIVSEASRRLPVERKAQYAYMPWRQIADIGNVLRHAYDTVNDRLVWRLVVHDLAPLEEAAKTMVANLDRP